MGLRPIELAVSIKTRVEARNKLLAVARSSGWHLGMSRSRRKVTRLGRVNHELSSDGSADAKAYLTAMLE